MNRTNDLYQKRIIVKVLEGYGDADEQKEGCAFKIAQQTQTADGRFEQG
jgi:hypothetical protein